MKTGRLLATIFAIMLIAAVAALAGAPVDDDVLTMTQDPVR